MANYYEHLYKKKQVRWHEQHDKIALKMVEYNNDRGYEDEWYNNPPTEEEIFEIIGNRKNGKATTDLKNELMKKTKASEVNRRINQDHTDFPLEVASVNFFSFQTMKIL